jgi:hypothetical protein
VLNVDVNIFLLLVTAIEVWSNAKIPIKDGKKLSRYSFSFISFKVSVFPFGCWLWAVARGRGSISKVEGHWPKGALLYMIKIKRVSMTSEMAFIESLLLQKRHFLSSKRGCLFMKYFFSFVL